MIHRSNYRSLNRIAAWTVGLCLVGGAAHAEPADVEFAKGFAEAWSHEAWDAVAFAIHPDELARVRKLALDAVEAEAKESSKDIRSRLFGGAVTVDDIRHMTPHATMSLFVKRFLVAPRAMNKTRVIGKVQEDKMEHVVVRGWENENGRGASSVLLVTLTPYGKQWAAVVPTELEEKIEAIIAGADVGARDVGDSHVAPLDPAIAKLLDTGISALKEARCSDYYNNVMSPSFRKATSAAAAKTLISQCEKSQAMRDRIRITLEVALTLRPRYEYDNTRAVFDMTGQGLPFDRFTVEMIDKKWYIAE